jgi:hypothetical protein
MQLAAHQGIEERGKICWHITDVAIVQVEAAAKRGTIPGMRFRIIADAGVLLNASPGPPINATHQWPDHTPFIRWTLSV